MKILVQLSFFHLKKLSYDFVSLSHLPHLPYKPHVCFNFIHNSKLQAVALPYVDTDTES